MIDVSRTSMQEVLSGFHLPGYNEIPNVGLYLEQVTKYVSEYLTPLNGISITSSMISNYVKKKLIPNPIRKCYYRDQIAIIFFIAIVKSVLSLEDIQMILDDCKENYEVPNAYSWFCDQFLASLSSSFGIEEQSSDQTSTYSDVRFFLQKMIQVSTDTIYLNTYFSLARSGQNE